ncbi:ABC transporter permease [Virgibacillus alimentarius]|uniref:Transport permease protein n=1 Tax=Virgibacillus alimentarius TaxID=698769 RepID=A0ABS4S7I0_9BACI|nr:ABC transporter permease [Virgibacillus alimentarius]MBP2257441.1 teichoic acid transport system permease protein [Virgibacillus alimentarius]
MKSVIKVIQEQINNMYLIRKMALFEMKSANKNNYLGMAWELITPAILIMIYWLVFGVGIRQRADVPVGDMVVPFLYWLMAGYMVWLFFSQSTTNGSKSIFSRLKIVSKMNFPMSIIPNYVICARFMVHAGLVAIIIVILQFGGYPINIYYLQIPYFAIATYIFTYALALILSTLSALVRDVHKLLTSTMRIGIYISPILWDVSNIKQDGSIATAIITAIVRLNPLTYLIDGYRAGFFGVGWHFIEEPGVTAYFWMVTLILFLIGSMLHVRLRKYFIDFL